MSTDPASSTNQSGAPAPVKAREPELADVAGGAVVPVPVPVPVPELVVGVVAAIVVVGSPAAVVVVAEDSVVVVVLPPDPSVVEVVDVDSPWKVIVTEALSFASSP
jgi:hypothetical protein